MNNEEAAKIKNIIFSSLEGQYNTIYGLINLKHDTIYFLDYTSQPINLTDFIHRSLEYSIHKEDRILVEEFFNKERMMKEFLQGKEVIALRYRSRKDNIFIWIKTCIMPSINFSEDNPELVILSYNINTETLENLILNQKFQYELMLDRKNQDLSETFYDDILDVVKTLTEPYIVFATVNLRQNIFLSYKTKEYNEVEIKNLAGHYEQTLEKYCINHFPEDEAKKVYDFLCIKNLTNQLSKQNMVYIKARDNKNRLIKIRAMKIYSNKNIPVKVNIGFMLDNEEGDLLTIRTFGNFEVIGKNNQSINFEKKQSKQVLAYLVDKRGYPITLKDIIIDVLEKDETDLNAQKYASALVRKAIADLKKAGYENIIINENHTYIINKDAIDCDFYHLLDGNSTYWFKYKNEYMKEYSWAEETNAEIYTLFNR